MRTIHILNGPNLNLLGAREPGVYGTTTLTDVERRCAELATALGGRAECRQTNHEGQLVDWLQEIGRDVAAGSSAGVVLNPGAYTHTSVAIRDAIAGTQVPVVEVHVTNVHAREEFRRHSFVTPVARGVIAGLGPVGYELAIRALMES